MVRIVFMDYNLDTYVQVIQTLDMRLTYTIVTDAREKIEMQFPVGNNNILRLIWVVGVIDPT